MPEDKMSDRWMTVKEVAEYLQFSTDQIYRLAKQGEIPASKIRKRWRFKKEKIDQWMEQQGVRATESGPGGKL